METLREAIAGPLPDLARLSRSRYPLELLAAVARSLAENGDSIRHFPRFLWLLLDSVPDFDVDGAPPIGEPGRDSVRLLEYELIDPAQARVDPEVLASHVRALVAEESWRAGYGPGLDHVVLIPADLELALAQTGVDAIQQWRVVSTFLAEGQPPVVVVRSPEAIRPVRDLLRVFESPPRVIAAAELPPDVPIPGDT